MAKHVERARGIGAKLVSGRGLVTSGAAMVVGAVASAVGGYLTEHTDFFNKYWWSYPVGTGVLGHIVKQTLSPTAGSAMLGSAGSSAYLNYRLHSASVRASGGSNTAGVQDTRGAEDDYEAMIRSMPGLPEAQGVQEQTRGNSVSAMRIAS